MMMGPEPMTRMRWRSERRGMDQVVDDVVARPAGRPPGRTAQLGVAADLNGNVDGPSEGWITAHLGGTAGAEQNALRQRAHAHPLAAADVVDLARGTVGVQGKIS